jgi:hypothetical protein
MKLMGVSPLPTTLEGLVDLAREFDRVYKLYAGSIPSKPPSRNTAGRPAFGRAVLTEDDGVNVNASSSRPETPRGKLTKEERNHRFSNKLCLYCGKPGHILRECKLKTQSMRARGGRPSNNARARGAFIDEDQNQEEAPTDHPALVGAMYREILPYNPDARPHSAPINEDF